MNEFKIFTGPMFGGKTTRLLAEADRYRYQNRYILSFKPKIDDRYSMKEIVTHNGFKIQAICITDANQILSYLNEVPEMYTSYSDVIIIVDEAFMIKNTGKILPYLYLKGYNVLASSLQLGCYGQPFEEMKEMLPWATSINICPAVCLECGEDAYYTKRDKPGKEIMVGGAEMYQPKCLNHYRDNINLSKFLPKDDEKEHEL